MEALINRFKIELVRKLDQRATNKSNAEATLIKSFKFFDLQNTGLLGKNEFFRGLAKVGVVPELNETEQLFAYFDQDQTGKVDYKEFTSFILLKPEVNSQQGSQFQVRDAQNETQSQQQNTQQSKQNIGYTQNKIPHNDLEDCEYLYEQIRQKLSQKGASGLLSFALMLKSVDSTGRKYVSINQLESALNDFKIKEDPQLIEKAFIYLDKHNFGSIKYEDFLNKIKVPLNSYRKSLITQAYAGLDRSNVGVINTAVIKSTYNPSNHPDVINRQRNEEDVKLEFRSSFESYLDLRDIHDDKMTFEDFVDYYSFLNHLWERDDQFKNLILNIWKLDTSSNKSYKYGQNNNQTPDKNQFSPPIMNQMIGQDSHHKQANQVSQFDVQSQQDRRRQNFDDDRQSQYSQQQNNFGRNQDQQNHQQKQGQQFGGNQYGQGGNQRQVEFDRQSQQSQQPQQKQRVQIGPSSQQVDQDTQSMCSQATSTRFMQENNVSQRQIELILIRIKNRLASKGARGFLNLERQLKTTDVDNDGRLTLAEFKKSVYNFKIEVTDNEIQIIFNLFDPQETGYLSLFDFLNSLKGQMNQSRFNIVNEVFNKLDQYGEGIITFSDIQREYYPRAHPDVKTAKKHEEDIAQELFTTLELHNKLYSDIPSAEISRDQFIDYFNNVSASIQDDQFFESILVSTFRLSQQNTFINKYAGQRNAFDPEKKAFLQDHHRYMVNGGTVSSNAPFGTSEEPTQYSTSQRPYTANSQSGSMRGSPSKQQNLFPPRRPQQEYI